VRVHNGCCVSKEGSKSRNVTVSDAELCLFANIWLARTSRLVELSSLLMCIRALLHFEPSLSSSAYSFHLHFQGLMLMLLYPNHLPI
jgi:hypothetical protein